MKKCTLIVAMGLAGLAGPRDLKAQNATVLASGLNAPMKLVMTPERNLLVSEATAQPKTSRISIVDRSGVRRTLIDVLPSGPGFPGNNPLGPSALGLDCATLDVRLTEVDLTS